jgi:hypothetical protein
MVSRTKAICIFGAFFTLLSIPGLILSLGFGKLTIGNVVVLTPLIVSLIGQIIGLIVFSVLHSRSKGLHGQKTENKKRYVALFIS